MRSRLSKQLEKSGLPPGAADQIAHWDPYDQNDSSTWFDAKYMFGVEDGFEVIIGNPPYIQLQKDGGKLGKLYGDAGYDTFARTGDIYQLFYEGGCRELRPGGLLTYITSNSWLKAEYGKPLRRYFAERHTPLRLLEMGKDVFENTIVDTSILLLRKGSSRAALCESVDMDKLETKDFPPDPSLWGQTRPKGEKPWSILSRAEQSVMEKIKAKGTPLNNWDVKTNRGITTGCNDAFIIDDATREALIEQDPKSAEIIKPVLRGRDIQRYRAKWADSWLIATFPSLELDVENYPAVMELLLAFGKDRLEQTGKILTGGGRSRKKTQNLWYEIQDATSYHEDFEKEKLIWMDMSNRGRFAYSETEMYCNDKGFILTGKSLKYLCAILNSSLITWLMKNNALTTGMGLMQWKKFAVERLPIPKIPAAKQRPIVRLVDGILKAKASDPAADTSEQEEKIDQLVYELYGLTKKEIQTIEESV